MNERFVAVSMVMAAHGYAWQTVMFYACSSFLFCFTNATQGEGLPM